MSKRRRLGDTSPGFGLSFVDMVSGGFGAAFFLFLLFASLPVQDVSTSAGGGNRFIEIMLRWPENDLLAEIYLELTIEGKAPQEVRLSSNLFSATEDTGRLIQKNDKKAFWSSGFSSGFSHFGKARMQKIDTDNETWFGTRFRLTDHCGGALRVGVAAYGATSGANWLGKNLESVEISGAYLKVLVSDGENPRQLFLNEDFTIQLADENFPIKQIKVANEDGNIDAASEVIEQITLTPSDEKYTYCE